MNPLCALLLCVTLSVSAYSDVGPTRWGGWERPAGPGIAACGPTWRPGTIVLVPGAGAFVCMDTGGLVTDKHLDIWVASEADAWAWGRQTLTVVVVR
jgi:3D (Asp-Asp-Asp) domain-containing protein